MVRTLRSRYGTLEISSLPYPRSQAVKIAWLGGASRMKIEGEGSSAIIVRSTLFLRSSGRLNVAPWCNHHHASTSAFDLDSVRATLS